MYQWNRELYVGKSIKRHKKKIQKRINEGKVDIGHYLITYAANSQDQLDIVSTLRLTEYDRRHLPRIVGLAGTRQEAYSLLIRMTEDCLKETGSADLRSYLQHVENRGSE